MFILGLGIESIPHFCAYFPCRIFGITELIGWNVVGSFGRLFAIAINEGHLFGNELFGLGVTCGCSKGEFGGSGFFAVLDITKGGVNFCVVKLDEILIGIDFFLFLLWGFVVIVVHLVF